MTKIYLLPVWSRTCSFKELNLVKLRSHCSHLYGFSSLWTGIWTFKSPARANLLWQTSHSNGFSPKCEYKRYSWEFLSFALRVIENITLQYLPECTIACLFKVFSDTKYLLQREHLNFVLSSVVNSGSVTVVLSTLWVSWNIV